MDLSVTPQLKGDIRHSAAMNTLLDDYDERNIVSSWLNRCVWLLLLLELFSFLFQEDAITKGIRLFKGNYLEVSS